MLNALRERWPAMVFVVGLMVLSFFAGAFVYGLRWPPYDQVRSALLAYFALKRQWLDYESPYETSLWAEARDEQTGVVIRDPARMQPGLTLFTSGHAPEVYLMTADGEIVHTWRVPPSLVTGSDEPDPFTYVRKGYVFPNGDLITFYEKVNATPWGLALVKVDKDSNLIWSFDEPIHHDFDLDQEGRIYALNTEIVQEPIKGLPETYFPSLDDVVVMLDSEGNEIRRVSVTRAFLNSPYKRLLQELKQSGLGDHFHTNNIDFVTPELAEAFPFLEAGQVVISTRHAELIAAIDLEQGAVTWAVTGFWHRAHDADLLPDGTMMIFDNRGNFGPGDESRVLQFDPKTMGLVWTYTGTEEQPLFSRIRSAQERLANGNTLITESDQGRILEVTADQEIVWDWRSPFRREGHPRTTAIVSWAHRIDPATLEGDFGETVRQAMPTAPSSGG